MIQKLYRRKYLVVFFFVLCGLSMFISAPKALALYTTAQINAKLEDGTATAVGFDNANCRTNLRNNINVTGTNSLRASINGDDNYRSASYYDKSWLSDVNTPNTNNPVTVPWGAGSAAVGGIPLQVNSVTFIC